ncbi:RNA-binding protein [Allosaccharopolyspora coralli]|uniref:RNA-binding protein n=1 Tax=Allosaccharopolyspora coralli TaxID=2665642 RepID=A0A5Q3Q6E5_9PSEU|nr:NYN domain-containing protein [Allosaccharopolyspora coralli]QGK69420.1 RNA-binding protein [Allosaccharopolyspora coralli]
MNSVPEDRQGQEGSPADDSVVDSAQQTGGVVAELDVDSFAPPLRARLADLAAAALGDMRAGDVPPPLRAVVRFAPAKRARLGQEPLVNALREYPVFRAAVVDWCRSHRPAAVELHQQDAVGAAAAAVLLDHACAPHYVELTALRHEQSHQRSERDSAIAKADKLAVEVEGLRRDLAEAREVAEHAGDAGGAEADRLRKRLREQGMRLREAKDAAEGARAEAERARSDSEAAVVELTAERDRERARAQDERQRAERAVSEVDVARQSAREARKGDEVRLSLLLETMEGALGGLRRELGTGEQGPRPADTLSGVLATGEATDVGDLAGLDRLLRLPAVHLVVDGYNVTKTGYPELPLADQRDRLAHQLATLAARTGAEVTLVFDGADVVSVPGAGPRGVRVLFSEPGVQADDVIRGLVRAEPYGRQIVVATSDRAVVRSVREHGARPVSSALLLSRLTRS